MEPKYDSLLGKIRVKDTQVSVVGNITFKGNKPTVADLPASGNEKGDMWRISADGSEYYWTGTQWDLFGNPAVVVDSAMSSTSANPVENRVVKAAIDGIVTCMPIPSEAVINGTTLAFCESLAASGKDKAGMMFLGSVKITDTPPGGQADMTVKIISKPAHPEAPQDNDFDTVYHLELNSTNTKERSWVTMYFKSRWPSAVSSPSGNPKEQGWYERTGGQYRLTEDTTVQAGKSYYALQSGSMCFGTTDCPWFSSMLAPAVSGYDSKTKCGAELTKQYRSASEKYVDDQVAPKANSSDLATKVTKYSGSGAPTTATVGAVGDLYTDTDTGYMYECTAVAEGAYTWRKVGAEYLPLSGGTLTGDLIAGTYFDTIRIKKYGGVLFIGQYDSTGSGHGVLILGHENSTINGSAHIICGYGHSFNHINYMVVTGRYSYQETIKSGRSYLAIGNGSDSLHRHNSFMAMSNGNLIISGGYKNEVMTIPPATTAYTFNVEGIWSHALLGATTYTLPNVTDVYTHDYVLYADLTTTASIAFVTAGGTAVTPKMATTPAVGEKWCFICRYQFGKWQCYGLRIEEAQS